MKNAKEKVVKATILMSFHDFKENEVIQCRQELLKWYHKNKRDLPWRKQAAVEDRNERAYGVWVSEIMLQQTQVVTVIDYYNRWMKKWPTLQALSMASLEEVNQLWSGLGYYSRGRRLHEAAKKVVEQNGGIMPKSADSLLKDLPGVGKYTAAAIASIAFSEATGLVDGNVVRVLSRLRAIGANSADPHIIDSFWELANKLVDSDQPGDFNQGLMELGATVCTPKAPSCGSCPLQSICYAYAYTLKNDKKLTNKLMTNSNIENVVDIECAADNCQFCIPASECWDSSLGVTNYPRKPKKKAPREERTAVFIVKCQKSQGDEFLLAQRQKTGLLAGMWEFPSCLLDENKSTQALKDKMFGYGVEVPCENEISQIGEVIHIFSHIHQTYVVEAFEIKNKPSHVTSPQTNLQWLTAEQLQSAAISTAMRKVFKSYENYVNGKTVTIKKRSSRYKGVDKQQLKKQKTLMESFFQPKKAN